MINSAGRGHLDGTRRTAGPHPAATRPEPQVPAQAHANLCKLAAAARDCQSILRHTWVGSAKLGSDLSTRHHRRCRRGRETGRDPYGSERAIGRTEVVHCVKSAAGAVPLPFVPHEVGARIYGPPHCFRGRREGCVKHTVLGIATSIKLRPKTVEDESVSLACTFRVIVGM